MISWFLLVPALVSLLVSLLVFLLVSSLLFSKGVCSIMISWFLLVSLGFGRLSPLLSFLFPECVARVPVSHAQMGVELCSLDVRNRPQPSATVRNRSQPSATVRNRPQPSGRGPYGRAYGRVSSAKGVLFRVFQLRVESFRVAGVVLRDIPTCFKTCQESFCVAGAILLLRFQKMRCMFRGRRRTLATSNVILRGRHSTLDVSCCVFFANRIVSAARSCDKVQIPWQAWHFVIGDENRREPRSKRRF